MYTDFRILQQVSLSDVNRASDLPRRALKACDAMVSAWKLVPADAQNYELVQPVAKKCREIAWEILGPLTREDKMKLAPWSEGQTDQTKVWAIGHW